MKEKSQPESQISRFFDKTWQSAQRSLHANKAAAHVRVSSQLDTSATVHAVAEWTTACWLRSGDGVEARVAWIWIVRWIGDWVVWRVGGWIVRWVSDWVVRRWRVRDRVVWRIGDWVVWRWWIGDWIVRWVCDWIVW